MDSTRITIADLHGAAEYATVRAHFPGGGHIQVEGRIKKIPSGGTQPASYWVAGMCLNANAVLSKDSDESKWDIYAKDFGGES